MREILFRGKRVSNGEWVYGDLINDKKFRKVSIMPYSLEGLPVSEWVVEVDPSTVGQYTGLKDKNGKMIFEGDIFSLGDKNILYVVEWNDTGLNGKQIRSTSWVGLQHWQDRIEVIATIHDQKEDV